MSNPKSFFCVFTESGPLIVLAVATALLVGIVRPASAQFFNFGGPPGGQPRSNGFGGGWFGGDGFAPFQQQMPRQQAPRHLAPRQILEDYSKAPPPEKRDTVPERNVLVLGDAMADWLAYGLEDAYAEQPEIGVIRKHKTVSGLIRYQPKGEPADWAAAAKGILATEKPDAIEVMLGLDDRVPLREPAAEKSDKPSDNKSEKQDARAKHDDRGADKAAANPITENEAARKPDDKSGACAPTTACISRRPAPVSSRISSSAKSRGYWLPIRRRLRYRPNPPAQTQMRCPVDRRHGRCQVRSCLWWHPRLGPTNCSAALA